jgi:hypothetical protein
MNEEDYEALVADLPSGVQASGPPSFMLGSGDPTVSAFKSVRRGMRIMYLPPTGTSTFSVTDTEADDDPATSRYVYSGMSVNDLFQTAWASSRSNKRSGDAFNQAANGVAGTGISQEMAIKSKAYKIIEMIDSTTVSYGSSTSATETGAGKAYLFKETNPIPIFDYSYTLEIGPPDLPHLAAPTVAASEVEAQVLNSDEFKTMIGYLFPLSRMQSILSLYCFHATSSKQEVSSAMAETKDKLRTVFFAINSKGDYKQKDPNLEEIGGLQGLDKMMANEFGLKDMPSGENSWNYNMPVHWGRSVKGLGFEMLAKATAEALQKMFKKWAEKHDPNISLAHKLALVSKMGGVDINTLAWSFMIMPMNVFPFAPIGPPIGPVAIIYHALGLGLWKRVKDDDSESATETNEALAALGLTDTITLDPPSSCSDEDDEAAPWGQNHGTLSAGIQRAADTGITPDGFDWED